MDALDTDFLDELAARLTAGAERDADERRRLADQRRRPTRFRAGRYGGGRYETVDVPLE